MVPYVVWSSNNLLGESPLWHPEHGKLYWIDLKKPVIHSFNPKTNIHSEFSVNMQLVSLMLHNESDYLIGVADDQIFLIDPKQRKMEKIFDINFNNKNITSNDAKCDQNGNVWISTKDKNFKKKIAGLHLLKAKNECLEIVNDLVVANGFSWSPNGKIVYLTDTLSRHIFQYDFDSELNALSNKRIFTVIPDQLGYPDGLTVDEKGFIWSAHWLGACVTRYDPEGQIDTVIKFPATNITSCCFGGENMQTLFVTSASIKFGNQPNLGEYPGALFSVLPGIRGLLSSKCAPF